MNIFSGQVDLAYNNSPITNFKVSDKVFIKAQLFKTIQLSKKLSEKYLEPYKIIS